MSVPLPPNHDFLGCLDVDTDECAQGRDYCHWPNHEGQCGQPQAAHLRHEYGGALVDLQGEISRHLELQTVAREFIAYYTTRDGGTGCSNCGGVPHSTTCFVARFQDALERAKALTDGEGREP
jgi:hypothetical protein